MAERRRNSISKTLFALFLTLALILVLAPLAVAPPPGACEPWPSCKGGGGGGGGDGTGNALAFATSNIVVAIQSSPPFKSMPPLQVWQSLDSNNYEMAWVADPTDAAQYSAVAIGNVDDDVQREIVAFKSVKVTTKVSGQRTTEYRVLFDVYEEGSTGSPAAQSEYFTRDSGAFIIYAIVEDVDEDPDNEVVAIVHDRLVIYSYDAIQGAYLIDFLSEPLLPVLGTSLREFDIGDVDGDSQLEIVTPAIGRGSILVWKRQGNNWAFEESERASATTSKARVGDIDGDDKLEIVGEGHDSATGTSYLFVWERNPIASSYDLTSVQSFNLEGDATFWGLDLGDVDGAADGREELVLGTSFSPGQALVLSFDPQSRTWSSIWSIENLATTNTAMVGDADGDPLTVELVFAGGKNGLYLEVFTWSAAHNQAISSWTFTGDFRPAWNTALG